ncbi:hypothetical protein GALL_484760 [mine drainage metagenome]|uniref:Uncharacterized protein n=1 Tax=mine drainage metagenome TaxID=410659 RepID=A0A1J5PEV9_9ZZZZ
MARDPRVDAVEIGVDGVLELHAPGAHGLDGGEDVLGPQRHVLDALALVVLQELLDLGVLVLALVERDADLAAGAGHGLGDQGGLLALDVEIADLAEIEDLLVELRPGRHVAAMDVMGQVVEIGKANGVPRHGRVRAGDGHEVDVVDLLGAVTVDQIEVRAADPLDRRDVQLHRPNRPQHRLRPALDRQLQGLGGVAHAERHGVGRGAMGGAEFRGLPLGLHVQDQVDVALAKPQHVLGAVFGDSREAHHLEQGLQALRLGRGEFDELEAVGAQWVVEQIAGRIRNLDVHDFASKRIGIV